MAPDVLTVFPHHSPFIDQDIDLLSRHFDTTAFEYSARRDRFRLLPLLRSARVAVSWFVLGYAYAIARLAPLLRVRTLAIAGGWDVEAIPELKYGATVTRRGARRAAYTLAHADRVLSVSSYTLGRVHALAPSAHAEVVYHGFDDARFLPGTAPKEGVMTTARVGPDTWRLKGLDTLVATARMLPDVSFTIAGRVTLAPEDRASLPPNMRCVGHLPQDELIRAYQTAQVYTQLSAVESFGCSLAESMLCGCVPVVTERGAMPEVVGEVGERVEYGNAEATADAIRRALDSDDGERARHRVQAHFPLRQRESRLVAEVHRLLDGIA